MLTTDLRIVPTLRMGGATSLYAFMAWVGTTLRLRVSTTFVRVYSQSSSELEKCP